MTELSVEGDATSDVAARQSRTDQCDISIIIVSWNTESILRDCLTSVFNNLGDLDAQVLVVDNASSDGSVDMVAKEFPAVALTENQSNLGFATANNQALKEATGRYVLLLNSDTVVLGDVLAQSLAYMEAHREVGVMGCRVLNADGSIQRTCFQFPSLFNLFLWATGLSALPWPRFFGRLDMRHWNRDSERNVDVVSGCYMLVRTAAIDDVGCLDSSFFFFGEETDWCRRFKAAGWRVKFAPVGDIIHLGGASAEHLNFERGIRLVEGLTRYHRKHNGLLASGVAWILCFCYFLTRWLAYVAVPTGKNRKRRTRFGQVLRHFTRSWPRLAAS